jgi:hypothetical protein
VAVEEKIIDALVDAAAAQVAQGSGVLSTVGVGNTLALGRYFFYGSGKNASEVLAELTGISIQQLLDTAEVAVAALQQVWLGAAAAAKADALWCAQLRVLTCAVCSMLMHMPTLQWHLRHYSVNASASTLHPCPAGRAAAECRWWLRQHPA